MNDMKMKNMLNQVDFSKETDLKERLRTKLFSANVTAFPSRHQLTDDELEYVNAAGQPDSLEMHTIHSSERK